MIKRIMIYTLLLFSLSTYAVLAQGEPFRSEERRNNRGILQYEAIDSNGDGNLDTFYFFDSNGLLERQEIDSNHNGSIDIIIHYTQGFQITHILRDREGNGIFIEQRF